jgi:hypothetical protein
MSWFCAAWTLLIGLLGAFVEEQPASDRQMGSKSRAKNTALPLEK